MIQKTARRRILEDRDGFVLTVTLFLLLLLGTLGLAILAKGRAGAEVLAEARVDLAETARAVSATALVVDAIDRNLPAGATWRWRSGESTGPSDLRFDIVLARESTKIDLNEADPRFVERGIEAALASKDAVGPVQRLREARIEGVRLSSVAALLSPCVRLTDARFALADILTVSSRDATISKRYAPASVFRLIPGITEFQIRLLEADRETGYLFYDDPRVTSVRPFLGEPPTVLTATIRSANPDGAPPLRLTLLPGGEALSRVIAIDRGAADIPQAFCR